MMIDERLMCVVRANNNMMSTDPRSEPFGWRAITRSSLSRSRARIHRKAWVQDPSVLPRLRVARQHERPDSVWLDSMSGPISSGHTLSGRSCCRVYPLEWVHTQRASVDLSDVGGGRD